MGRDKALLELGGQPLVTVALGLLRGLGLDPRICGSRADLSRFAGVVVDNFAACGPLAGIEAALAASGSGLNLFVPVDMPRVPGAFLRWLMERAETTDAVATIPMLADRPQPLCAVYSHRLLEGLRHALRQHNCRVMTAIREAASAVGEPVDAFPVEEIAAALPPGTWPAEPPLPAWFSNLNRPEDYAQLQAELERSSLIQ